MDPKNINLQTQNPISLPSLENKRARVNPKIIIIIVLVFILIIGLIFLSIKLTKKPSSGLKETQNGVFISFSATATGKVTKVSSSEIEIENGGEKRTFNIKENVFITKKSVLDNLTGLLIKEALAQEQINMPIIPPRPGLPSDNIQSSTSGILNIPPAPRKGTRDIKVGDMVNLSLTKNKEADPWIVTGITVLPN